MIEAYPISSPLDWSKLIPKVDFEKETLIISNLRTKKEIQNQILKRQSYFEDQSVLRISDFWKMMASRAFPQDQLINSDLAIFYIRHFLKQEQNATLIDSSTKTFYQMLVQLGPLYLSAQSKELWAEWRDENQQTLQLLSPWLPWVEKIITQLRSQKKLLLDWVPALIHGDLNFEKKWTRPLWIDLGAELTSTEAAVFETLATRLPIRFFYPETDWTSSFSYLLKPYETMGTQPSSLENLTKDLEPKKKSATANEAAPLILALKDNSRLAEVKNAVAQAREWIHQGVRPQQIAILSAQIEKYWPILKSFMDVEGLPAQKKQVSHLISCWPVVQWLSRLQGQSKSLDTSDYEIQFYNPFDKKNEPVLPFEDFVALFKNLYDEHDLQRWKKIDQYIKSDYRDSEMLSRDEFILHGIKFWPDRSDTSDLETLLREVLKNVDENFELTFKDWIDWVEKIATQKEKIFAESVEDGIEVSSLMSDHSFQVTHRIVLGVCEEDFKTTSISFLSTKLRNQLSVDLGFSLEDPEQNFKHFQIRWLLQKQAECTVLSVGLTDFDGALLTPLSLWYQYPESPQILRPSRWDQLQKSDFLTVLAEERKVTSQRIESIQNRLQMDEGLLAEPNCEVLPTSLSPSRLESYLKCPFVYKAQKVYRLSSLPEIDIDVDPMTRGQFVHELFEKILTDLHSPWSDQQINALIEMIKSDRALDYYQEPIWLLQKKKYFRLARKFIDFEKSWSKKYPATTSHQTEVQWSVAYHRQEKIFALATDEVRNDPNWIVLNGQIDRIDLGSKGQICVIDYKSSLRVTVSFSKWLEKNSLQLIFYAWVIDRGFVRHLEGEVVNASYYNFKDFSRDHGFQLDTASDQFLPMDIRPSQKMTAESKANLFEAFEAKLVEVLDRIQSGELQPKPFDPKECPLCEWKKLCRSPHLN